jgi:hypothetical protein
MLKLFFKSSSNWQQTLILITLTYISQFSFWENLGIYSYLDAAFVACQKLLPAWFPMVWGGVIDTLHGNLFGATSFIFLICQILSYFMKKIWSYRWFYVGCGLSFVILLYDFVLIYFCQEKISLQSSLRGLVCSVFFVFLIEPFLNRKKVVLKKSSTEKISQSKNVKKFLIPKKTKKAS